MHCCVVFADSTHGRGYRGNFSAAVVAVLPGHVRHASPEGQFSTAEELPVHDAVDAPHRIH